VNELTVSDHGMLRQIRSSIEPPAAVGEQEVETSMWWLFVGFVLGLVGCYSVLAVHLVLEATTTNPWMLAWNAIPAAFFIASGLAFFAGTDLSPRERLGTASAALLGYSPRTTSAKRPPA
jgi:hypothetical protein